MSMQALLFVWFCLLCKAKHTQLLHSHHDTSRGSKAAAEPTGVSKVAAEYQQRTQDGAGTCCDDKAKGQGKVSLYLHVKGDGV